MFYIIFATFGGLSGYSLARHTWQVFADSLPPGALYANFGALILVGVLLGVTVAPWLASLMTGLVDRVAVALQALPIQEVLMGSIGLLFGLIIAFLVNLALQQIKFEVIPIIGEYLGPLAILVSTLFLGTLGAYFGGRMVFIHSLKQLLETGGVGHGLQRMVLLDTSVVVDGRIIDLHETGFLDGMLVVPRFVLAELQQLADSEDACKRNRGRRGLDLLNDMRKSHSIQVNDRNYEERGVDAKLIRLAQDLRAHLCTTDYNLAKVAAVQGVKVLNINELANALKPVVLPGELLEVKILREGKESGQGIAYLDDGTMIVVEEGRRRIGELALVEITSVVQTAAGRMFFSRYREPASRSAASSEKPVLEEAAVESAADISPIDAESSTPVEGGRRRRLARSEGRRGSGRERRAP
ncbi:MAG: PIN/TRAM domain-containing protein [Candidatus Xenobium sp.]|jgi:uncharacterized protein YacL|nr:TRAM domain-containing protein [Burkholderiales bacterium]